MLGEERLRNGCTLLVDTLFQLKDHISSLFVFRSRHSFLQGFHSCRFLEMNNFVVLMQVSKNNNNPESRKDDQRSPYRLP